MIDVKGIKKQKQARALTLKRAKAQVAEDEIIIDELENLFSSLGIEDTA